MLYVLFFANIKYYYRQLEVCNINILYKTKRNIHEYIYISLEIPKRASKNFASNFIFYCALYININNLSNYFVVQLFRKNDQEIIIHIFFIIFFFFHFIFKQLLRKFIAHIVFRIILNKYVQYLCNVICTPLIKNLNVYDTFNRY